jgi:hypothetical protein
MRNDPKILALRRKHGLNGYAVYVMTIEALSNASNFQLDISPMGREILAGDFGIDESTFETILSYCVQIDLLQRVNDVLTCKTLNNRLVSLISRRVSDDINITETPQKQDSKVKESKGKESKLLIHDDPKTFGETHSAYFIVASTHDHPACRVNGPDGLGLYFEANGSILTNKQLAPKFMTKHTGKKFNDFSHVWNAYALWIEKQFK